MCCILSGHINSDLYCKKDTNKFCTNVTAMKFYNGVKKDCIFCTEQYTEQCSYIIITAEIFTPKRTNINRRHETLLIEKIGKYEYQIQK